MPQFGTTLDGSGTSESFLFLPGGRLILSVFVLEAQTIMLSWYDDFESLDIVLPNSLCNLPPIVGQWGWSGAALRRLSAIRSWNLGAPEVRSLEFNHCGCQQHSDTNNHPSRWFHQVFSRFFCREIYPVFHTKILIWSRFFLFII